MASTSLSYTGPADGQASVSLQHTGSTPDAQVPSFFAAYRDAYGTFFDNVLKVVTKSATDSTGAANAQATDAQVFERYAQGIADGTATQVTRYLQQQAAAAAIAQVPAAMVTQTA